VKAYFPKENVSEEIKRIAKEIYKENFNDQNFTSIKLCDPLDKYNVNIK
jgi:hypothetical protein